MFFDFVLRGRKVRYPEGPLAPREAQLRDQARADIEHFTGAFGERHYRRLAPLRGMEAWLRDTLAAMGHVPAEQAYADDEGIEFRNFVVEIPGTAKAGEILVFGAHYDTIMTSPGANDNGTGIACILALCRAFRAERFARTVRLVFFANEEPPYFQTPYMGSFVYAKSCREAGENIVGMVTPETIGYYSNAPKSQNYPGMVAMLFPNTGNFAAFVGNAASKSLVERSMRAFQSTIDFPAEGIAAPDSIPNAGFSDQWSFWQFGYPGLMITDTAPFRYPHYHTPQDTPDKIAWDPFARVLHGIEGMARALANE